MSGLIFLLLLLSHSTSKHNFTCSLAARDSEERTAALDLIASLFLLLSPSKRDSTLLRVFLFILICALDTIYNKVDFTPFSSKVY